MKYLLLFVFIFTFEAKASCEELYADYNALMTLSPRDDFQFNCATFDVNYLLPPKIRQLLSTTPEYFGPNCWNSVLFLTGMTNDLRHSVAEEMIRGFEYFQCKPLKRSDKILPGDIIRLKDKNQEDIHSFYFISANISLTKNGPETKTKYELKPATEILKDYSFDPNCLTYDKVSPHCSQYISAIRCPKITNPATDDLYSAQLHAMSQNIAYIVQNYRALRTTDSFYPNLQILKTNMMFLRQSLRFDYLNQRLEFEYYERQLSILESLEAQVNFF